jgi:hypothetical protein
MQLRIWRSQPGVRNDCSFNKKEVNGPKSPASGVGMMLSYLSYEAFLATLCLLEMIARDCAA